MKKLGYPPSSHTWIRPYYSAMSEWDKDLTATAFRTPSDQNQECVILVATDAYGMGIDNLDIKLVAQWDLPISFDTIIQRMGRAGRKGGQSTFICFSPKWTKIKDPDEIETRAKSHTVSSSSQSSNANRPNDHDQSPLSQTVTAESLPDIPSDTESAADSENEEFGTNASEDHNLVASLLGIGGEESKRQSRKRSSNKTDAEKRRNLPDEIFEYIHVARCRRLFSLVWYDDMTYARTDDAGVTTPLPTLCCNGPDCLFVESDYLRREPFIDLTPANYTEIDRECGCCVWYDKVTVKFLPITY